MTWTPDAVAELDEASRKITLKLVYYGPALSGKTTNLMRLHDLLPASARGELMTLETQNDRTLFFDLRPLVDRTLFFDLLPLGLRAPSGWLIKAKLFTVPGQVAHDATRKAVLSRADGVVFVADSQVTQGENNAQSFENLEDSARRVGLDFETLPLVVQFNKRDLPNAVAEADVRERWGGAPWPLAFASALSGDGVRETFSKLLDQVYPALDRACDLATRHGLDRAAFRRMAGGES